MTFLHLDQTTKNDELKPRQTGRRTNSKRCVNTQTVTALQHAIKLANFHISLRLGLED